MANFQDNRFFGFSLRTAGISFVILAITVGLFFIPEFIKGQISKGPSKGRVATEVALQKDDAEKAHSPREPQKRSPEQKLQFSEDGVPAAKNLGGSRGAAPAEERASLSSSRLSGLTEIDALMKEPVKQGGVVKPTPKAKAADPAPAKEGGFFGGLIKGRRGSSKGDVVPTGLTMENLSSRDAQSFFKRGQSDISKFSKQSKTLSPVALDALQKVSESYAVVVRGGMKPADSAEVAAEIQRVHRVALDKLVKNRTDRGKIIEYLGVPAVAFVEQSLGGHSLAAIRAVFAPPMFVRNLSIRQQRSGNIPALGDGGPLTVSAEVAVKGSDVEKVGLFIGGQRQREIRPGSPGADGYRVFRVSGSGQGVWSLVAYDKYGARPFTKLYSFRSRARWFRRSPNGEYDIAFRPGSGRGALDRFFYVGGTRLGSGSRDPSISVF